MRLAAELQLSLYLKTGLIMDRKEALTYASLEVLLGSEFQGPRDLLLQDLSTLLTEAELISSYLTMTDSLGPSLSGRFVSSAMAV